MEYLYNGINPFTGICEPPLLSRSEEILRFGTNYITKTSFVLSGQINIGQCSTLQSSYNKTKALIVAFASNFKSFEITENSTQIFLSDSAFIESIEFPESLFLGIVPFQIKISCYQFDDESFPVLDQREEFSFSEEDGCLVSITHTVSCRGTPIGGNDPITVAKDFVAARTGYTGFSGPYGYSVTSPILKSRTENVNKMTGEVTLTEVFVFDKSNSSGSSSFILSYTTEVSEKDGVANVTISGTLQGSVDSSISAVRTHFSSINLYSICNTEFQSTFSTSENLEIFPTNISSSEDIDAKQISFSISYRNSPQGDVFLVPTFTYSNNKDGVVCFTADITIRSLFGCPSFRLTKTQQRYKETDWFSYIYGKYIEYGYSGFLSNTPKSKSYSIDHESGDISFSMTFCNDTLESCIGGFTNFKYSLAFSPPIPQFSEFPSVDGEGCYYVQDLNFLSRGKFSINGTATPSKCLTVNETKSKIAIEANKLMVEYFQASDIILEAQNIEISDDKTVVSFSFSWNGLQPQGLDNQYVYATF